mgnify:CR=1 FL=1
MCASQFDGRHDPDIQKPSATPNIIIGIVVVLGLGLMVWLGLQEPKRATPPPPAPVDTAEDVAPPIKDVMPPVEEPAPVEEVEPARPATKHQPPTQQEIDAAKKAGTRAAVIKTARGDITVELYGKDAPLTVANFVKLAKAGFYDGLNFHRVEPGFVVQGGDPNGDGSGGPGYTINREISPTLRHVEGALAMARADDPNSAGCQFYITLAQTDFLDDAYAVFGKVITGMDVVKRISRGDRITSITVK